MTAFVTGFVVALGLIVAIGAQNAWVLSQSMRGQHRAVIAMVCIVCDSVLITLGVYSVHHLREWLPSLVPVLTWAGVALLLWLAWNAAQRAIKGTGGLKADPEVRIQSAWQIGLTALAITLLNPHVYLDTVVLIGSVGSSQTNKLAFVMGACLASLTWFSLLTGLAPKLAKILRSPKHWRIFDGGMAALLSIVALSLIPFSG